MCLYRAQEGVVVLDTLPIPYRAQEGVVVLDTLPIPYFTYSVTVVCLL